MLASSWFHLVCLCLANGLVVEGAPGWGGLRKGLAPIWSGQNYGGEVAEVETNEKVNLGYDGRLAAQFAGKKAPLNGVKISSEGGQAEKDVRINNLQYSGVYTRQLPHGVTQVVAVDHSTMSDRVVTNMFSSTIQGNAQQTQAAEAPQAPPQANPQGIENSQPVTETVTLTTTETFAASAPESSVVSTQTPVSSLAISTSSSSLLSQSAPSSNSTSSSLTSSSSPSPASTATDSQSSNGSGSTSAQSSLPTPARSPGQSPNSPNASNSTLTSTLASSPSSSVSASRAQPSVTVTFYPFSDTLGATGLVNMVPRSA